MVDETTKALAEQIVQYETQDKGFFGKLFAFEARDGFWSKLVKVINNTINPITFGVAGFALASTGFAAGPVVAAAVAAGTALIGGVTARVATNSVLSDMHDSQKGTLSKLGHYLATNVLAILALTGIVFGIMVAAGMPTFGVAVASATNPASLSNLCFTFVSTTLPMFASSGIAAVFGDHQLMRQSENARGLAEIAISKGQSVEQALGQTVSQVLAPQHGHAAAAPHQNYKNSVTPDEYLEMQARMQQGAPAHEKRHAERAATPQSHEPVVAG